MGHDMALAGFAHGSGETWIFQELADRSAKSLRITLRNYAALASLHNFRCTDFRSDHDGEATPHGLQHGIAKVL
jgi:hypothetical protein